MSHWASGNVKTLCTIEKFKPFLVTTKKTPEIVKDRYFYYRIEMQDASINANYEKNRKQNPKDDKVNARVLQDDLY